MKTKSRDSQNRNIFIVLLLLGIASILIGLSYFYPASIHFLGSITGTQPIEEQPLIIRQPMTYLDVFYVVQGVIITYLSYLGINPRPR